MTAEVIPLPTLEILQKARAVISRPNDYDEDVVLTAIQTLMWRGNWIDYERAALLNKAIQVERANRWLKAQEAAKAEADRSARAEWVREFRREVVRPALWLAGGFAVAAMLMAAVAKAGDTAAIGNPIPGTGPSMVFLRPSDKLGVVGEFTFRNEMVNSDSETGAQIDLDIPGLVVRVTFAWNVAAMGEDAVTLEVPEGVICVPSCTLVVDEADSAVVYLYSAEGVGA